jgi:ribosomal protein L16 Arg81 hydroxylase
MLTLSELLGIEPDTLEAEVWDQKPLVAPSRGAPVLQRFDAASFQTHLGREDLPADRVVVKGFVGPVDVARADGTVDPVVATERVYRQDHALIFNGAQAFVPSIAQMALELEADRGCLVQSNVYRTVAGTFAYPLHWDTHGLVVVQLAGAKKWDLYAPVHTRPIPGQIMGEVGAPDIDMARPTQTVALKAGDVMYLPRGWGHRVVTTGEESVHITFGFHALSEHELLDIALRQVKASLASDPHFRAYPSQGTEDLAAEAGRRLTEAMEDARRAHSQGSIRLSKPMDHARFTLQQRHFFAIPEPVRGRVRIERRTALDGQPMHELVSPEAARVLDHFNRSPSWSAEELAQRMDIEMKLVDELLLELVQKDLILAPTTEKPHDHPELV